jgi:hypothetical protein
MMIQVELDCHRTESDSGFCELDNEVSGPIKGEEFLGQSSNYNVFKKFPGYKSGRDSCDSLTGYPISAFVAVLQLLRI